MSILKHNPREQSNTTSFYNIGSPGHHHITIKKRSQVGQVYQ